MVLIVACMANLIIYIYVCVCVFTCACLHVCVCLKDRDSDLHICTRICIFQTCVVNLWVSIGASTGTKNMFSISVTFLPDV